MTHQVSRRDALRVAAVAVAAPLAWRQESAPGDEIALPVAPAADGTKGLTSYIHDGQISIRWNNFIVATYRTAASQKYPYFSHLAGPASGLPLTTESSLPFPHHRGLWIGCDPLNGGDYWRDSPLAHGQIRSVDARLGETTAHSVEILDRCQWLRRAGSSPLRDERRMTFRIVDDRIRLIDFDVTMTALEDISVAKAKHSFFALRVAPDLAPHGGGRLENSAGDIGETGTYGKAATWCGYYGKRSAQGRAAEPNSGSHGEGRVAEGRLSDIRPVEGIAVMEHPANPWNPCPWFTRDYGHLSPSPLNFLQRPWELAEGASIRLRYRVALHAGSPTEAGLNELYNEWKET